MYRVYMTYMGYYLDYVTDCLVNAQLKAESTGLTCEVKQGHKTVGTWSPIGSWRFA